MNLLGSTIDLQIHIFFSFSFFTFLPTILCTHRICEGQNLTVQYYSLVTLIYHPTIYIPYIVSSQDGGYLQLLGLWQLVWRTYHKKYFLYLRIKIDRFNHHFLDSLSFQLINECSISLCSLCQLANSLSVSQSSRESAGTLIHFEVLCSQFTNRNEGILHQLKFIIDKNYFYRSFHSCGS